MSVEKRNGYWYFRRKVIDPVTNEVNHKRFGKWKTKREAQIAETKFLANQDNYTVTSATLNEVFELYKKEKQTSVKEVTMYDMNSRYKTHIEAYLGDIPMVNIKTHTIKNWQLERFNAIKSNNYFQSIQILLKSIFSYALDHDIIYTNPFKKVKLMTKIEPKKEMKYLTFEQFQVFESYLEDEQFYKEALITLYYTGLRLGELQALTWNDYKGDTLYIHKTYNNKLKKVSNTTKTTVNRYVLLTDNVIDILDTLKTEFERFKDFTSDKFIFGYYEPISSKIITKLKDRAINQANKDGYDIPRIRIHDLRHSHVSLLKNSGFSSFEIAKRVGNTELEINKTYAHLFNETQIKMQNKLNNYVKSYPKVTQNDIET